MATLLGTLYGNLSGWPSYPDYFAIDIYLESQNYAVLTSSLRFEWYVKRPGSDYTTYKQNAYWVQTTQAGTESEEAAFNITDASPGAWYYYVTTYATIEHNPDGTRTLALDAAIDLTGTSAGTASVTGKVSPYFSTTSGESETSDSVSSSPVNLSMLT